MRGQGIRGIAIYSFQVKSERKQEEIRESYHCRSLQSVLAMVTKRINRFMRAPRPWLQNGWRTA
jgi:hypothetical protein